MQLPRPLLAVPLLQAETPVVMLRLLRRRKRVSVSPQLSIDIRWMWGLISHACIEKEESDDDMGFGLFD